MLKTRISISVLTILILFSVRAQSSGQSPSLVKRITAETADDIHFTAWTASEIATFGRDVTIQYQVRNRGSQTIYLVKESIPKIETIDNDDSILIEAPYPDLPKHNQFDYSFTKVEPGKSLQGQFTIPHQIIKRDEIWPIKIGFGYVTDVTDFDLRGTRGIDSYLGNLLKARIQVVVIGELTIKFEKPK